MVGATSRAADRAVLVCADVLGAFGVSASDVKRYGRKRHTVFGKSVEVLEEVLALDVEPTALLGEMIASGDRGIECPARYPDEALAVALSDAFEAVRWSVDVEPTGDGFTIEATDADGRQRSATIAYPETPLGSNNAPAVLHGINEWILFGTDAKFVLLSSGSECWRAVLVQTDALEDVRERYGDRVPAFDRPLLPPVDLESFVPDAHDEPRDPWPAWATDESPDDGDHSDRVDDGEPIAGNDRDTVGGPDRRETSDVDRGETAAVDRGETAAVDRPPGAKAKRRTDPEIDSVTVADVVRTEPTEPPIEDEKSAPEDEEPAPEDEEPAPAGGGTVTRTRTRSPAVDDQPSASPIGSQDGYELVGGSPTVSRPTSSSTAADSAVDDGSSSTGDRDDAAVDRTDHSSLVSARPTVEPDELEFGVLSGPVKTARVSNESFGADVEPPSEDDQIRAVGIAIGSGENISVRGLLDDDEFLPKLPAIEPEEIRIEYRDTYDPAALPKAKAAAEESGFVWVDSGSIETTRVPNG